MRIVEERVRSTADALLVGRALEDEVASLKAIPGGDIVVTGSISIVHSLVSAGFVDEYRLFVYPVIVGTGRRLFAHPIEQRDLQLVETHPFSNGVVLLR